MLHTDDNEQINMRMRNSVENQFLSKKSQAQKWDSRVIIYNKIKVTR